MRAIYLKSLSYPYSFGRFIFLELPYTTKLMKGQYLLPLCTQTVFCVPNGT